MGYRNVCIKSYADVINIYSLKAIRTLKEFNALRNTRIVNYNKSIDAIENLDNINFKKTVVQEGINSNQYRLYS